MGCSCKVRSARRRGGGGGGQPAGEGVPDIYLPFSRGGLWTILDLLRPLAHSLSRKGSGSCRWASHGFSALLHHFAGMYPSSTSTTPFSVKDILNLEHQNNFATEFLMASQDVPVHYQQGDRGHFDAQPEPPFVSGLPEKLDAQISATEEEMNEHGEI